MNIGLDYDGCASNCPVTFANIIYTFEKGGHRVYLVTMRYPSECENISWIIRDTGIPVFATSRKAKRPYMESQGIKIHVWIDDNPEAVHMDADQIWPDPAPEGAPIDVIHD